MIKLISYGITLLASLSVLTACASLTTGTQQTIHVETDPIRHASCSLRNSKGRWYIPNTPSTITVHRSYDNLQIDCKKRGYGASFAQIASATNKGAYLDMIMVGGIVMTGIDMADGAAYDYPSHISIPITRYL